LYLKDAGSIINLLTTSNLQQVANQQCCAQLSLLSFVGCKMRRFVVALWWVQLSLVQQRYEQPFIENDETNAHQKSDIQEQ